MATTYTTETDWALVVLDPNNIDGGDNPPGAAYQTPPGYTWKRDEYVVTLEKFGQGCSSFLPLIGTEVNGTSVTWKNGTDTLSAADGDTYTCIENLLLPFETGSAIWREVIVWQFLDVWVETEVTTAA